MSSTTQPNDSPTTPKGQRFDRLHGLALIIGLGLFAVRIPFFLTHHIQEDAHISWRCAITLADSGTYGFNPGEKVSASTSHLYVFLAAAIRLVFGTLLIPVITATNTVFVLVALWLLTGIFFGHSRARLFAWAVAACCPIALLISFSGMETALLLLLTAVAIAYASDDRHTIASAIALGLLPWVRPDAAAIAVIIILANFWRSPRKAIPLTVGLVCGLAGLAAFNVLYFGALLNQTITAKSVAYPRDHSLLACLRRIFGLFVGDDQTLPFALPVATKTIARAGLLFLIAGGFAAWRLLSQAPPRSAQKVALITFSVITVALPIFYGIGGIMFAWYFWPSTFFLYLLIALFITLVLRRSDTRVRTLVLAATGGGLALCMTLQLAQSYKLGVEEMDYRAGIGRYLATVGKPSDTVFLEPLGYIPFYSGLRAYDVIGLDSPLVTQYRKQYQSRWWAQFLRSKTPRFLVERAHILESRTKDGDPLTPEDSAWFTQHYRLIRHFSFEPGQYTSNPLKLRLLQTGTRSADDYYVFEYAGS